MSKNWEEAGIGVAAMQQVIEFLDDQFLGSSCTCDGTTYGCIGCDAARLKVELERFKMEVEWLDEEPSIRNAKLGRYHKGR